MKDFDEVRNERRKTDDERTFVVGGETFRVRSSIKPEWVVPYEDLDPNTNSAADYIAVMDDLVRAIIVPDDDAAARYTAVRAREEDALDLTTLRELIGWMIEMATGRPTGPRADSSPTRASTGTSSTGDSSLRAVETA